MDKKKGGRVDVTKNIRLFVLFGGILLMVAAQCIKSPEILSSWGVTYNYIVRTILAVGSTALIASGVTFVIISGNNDLSTGVMMQFAASVACVISSHLAQAHGEAITTVISFLVPILICMAIGAINGVLVGVFRLNAFVTTLGTTYIIQAVHVLFNGGNTVYPAKLASFLFLGKGRIAGKIPFSIIFIAVVFVILGFVLHKTTFGRNVYAVGGNATAAMFSGINPKHMIIGVYMLSGMMAGIAGTFVASYAEAGDMLMGVGKEFDAIVAVVLGGALLTGGVGGMVGTVLGSLFLGVLSMFYIQFNVNVNVQWIIRGSMMLGIILMNGFIDKLQGGRES